MGVYPIEFFGGQPSWAYKPWPEFNSEHEMLGYLTEKLCQAGGDVFVRDNSFLGMPAYTIVVPGVSGHTCGADILELRRLAGESRSLLPTGKEFSTKQLNQLVRALLHNSRQSKRTALLPGVSDTELMIAALFALARHREALPFISRLVAFPHRNSCEYYKCLRQFTEHYADGGEMEQISGALSLFYPSGTADQVLSDWFKENPFARLQKMYKSNVSRSAIEETNRIYSLLKTRQQQAGVHREKLAAALAER